MTAVGDIWYRYDDVSYAPPVDEYGDCYGQSTLKVELTRFVVVKLTPKGVKLAHKIGDFALGEERFVAHHWRKRFAAPTKDAARESFIARKDRQARIYEARAATARKAIAIINRKHELGI
jgi:hypothetical protein